MRPSDTHSKTKPARKCPKISTEGPQTACVQKEKISTPVQRECTPVPRPVTSEARDSTCLRALVLSSILCIPQRHAHRVLTEVQKPHLRKALAWVRCGVTSKKSSTKRKSSLEQGEVCVVVATVEDRKG